MEGIEPFDLHGVPEADLTAALVEAFQRSFFLGGAARADAVVRRQTPPATDPRQLTAEMQRDPLRGWSCWDVAMLMVEVLRREGLDAGVTLGIGAEPGAPAEPHALVRVYTDTRATFLADPYFGIGAIAPVFGWCNSSLVQAGEARTLNHRPGTIAIRHVAYDRSYAYHVLPKYLDADQLHELAWQAINYGPVVRHLRVTTSEDVYRLVAAKGSDPTRLRRWRRGRFGDKPVVREVSWYDGVAELAAMGREDREAGLRRIFEGADGGRVPERAELAGAARLAA